MFACSPGSELSLAEGQSQTSASRQRSFQNTPWRQGFPGNGHLFRRRCASRRGLIVGFLRILCNSTCTDQRSKTEGYQQVCRVECPNEFGSLSIVNVFEQDTMLCFGLLYGTCLQISYRRDFAYEELWQFYQWWSFLFFDTRLKYRRLSEMVHFGIGSKTFCTGIHPDVYRE